MKNSQVIISMYSSFINRRKKSFLLKASADNRKAESRIWIYQDIYRKTIKETLEYWMVLGSQIIKAVPVQQQL